MQIDVQKIINYLTGKIGQLEGERAVMSAQMEAMAERIQELESSQNPEAKEPKKE